MSWNVKTIGELCEQSGGSVQTGPFGSQLKQSEYISDTNGIPVVMPKDIRAGSIDESCIARISETKANALGRHMLAEGDIVFPRRGEINKRGYIKEGNKYLCGTGCLKIHMPDNEVLNKFLFYYLDQERVVKWLEGRAIGSTMLNLNSSIMRSVNVNFPDRESQKKIVSTLSAYDDLIENNKRRIELLEESARQLYKEWFVRFRFPGHEHVKIVDGVPEGWARKSIFEMSSYLSRGMTPLYNEEGKFIVINQKCIRNRLLSLELARKQSRDFSKEKLVRKGDVLINSTGTGTLGRVSQCWKDIDNCTVDTHVTIARPIESISSLWFGFTLLEMEQIFEGMGEGATNQKELKRDLVGALKLNVPTKTHQEEFQNFTSDIVDQINNLIEQNTKLIKVRDILLPKLMSGAINV